MQSEFVYPDLSTAIDACELLSSCQDLNSFRRNAVRQLVELCGARAGVLYGRTTQSESLVSLGFHDQQKMFCSAPEISLSIGKPFSSLLQTALLTYEAVREDHTQGQMQLSQLRDFIFKRSGILLVLPIASKGNTETDLVAIFIFKSLKDLEKVELYKLARFGSVIAGMNRLHVTLNSLLNETNDLSRSVNHLRDTQTALKQLGPKALSGKIVGSSKAIVSLRQKVICLAGSSTNVLILGETGTGKELVAQSLHALSDYSAGPFVAENIAALSETLIESELFGHVKGAFSGAHTDRPGLIRKAAGGTLFLDEIADMPLSLQAKLLRVLQERSVRPVGSEKQIPVNFRLITATHGDLENLVSEGRFRQDLFFRLNQSKIMVPPLRERASDIPILVRYFLTDIASRQQKRATVLDESGERFLQSRDYPGNIRELKNVVEHADAVCSAGGMIDAILLNELDIPQIKRSLLAHSNDLSKNELGSMGLKEAQQTFERNILARCYEWHDGDRVEMARFLRIPKRTLAEKLVRYDVFDKK